MILQIDPGALIILFRETAVLFAIYGIYVLSLNLEVGYLGLPQFGKVMFLALGGLTVGGITTKIALEIYKATIASQLGIDPLADIDRYCSAYQYQTVTIINNIFSMSPLYGTLFFLLSITLAALLAGVFGVLMAGPALRLREDYLGILLLVSAETIRVITTYTPPIACGVFGAVVPDPFAWMGSYRPWGYLAITALFLLLTLVILERLGNSPFGRALRAIRDAEVAARVFGKDIVKFRVRVLATASALSGVAGALLVFYNNFVNMGQFVPLYTFIAWAMLIIGGTGNNIGALIGVAVYYALERIISIYKESIRSIVNVDPIFFQYIIFGIAIILVLMFRPQGIFGEKPSKTLSRNILEKLRKEV
ncbi:amino acid/amide ABC transporter membrane protein 2, HAAT family [Pyrobaculum islandicum DSM 4184]|uniref:Amino acid/amide ABC transporter membrane protein 2, HAAT family n=1 Tax=Pyrobaculum islandicum (strain DSM 4184 / JCM 9189 / GEO3) TaxID=384616 RepID=A1RS36_PYRIL|nr:branched-chain amino acid ABC transporter permease [Pyrobaculum islandicum]ABL87768.1 amino acid/amide ABC transporter membrane protein 2, HAAT family [Pyrobaculum islandicum DSM 4184]